MSQKARSQPPGAPAVRARKSHLLVFHINDNTDDQILFQAACAQAQVPFNWHVVDCSAKALSYLQHLVAQSKLHPVCWPDLVVLDIELPGANGFAVLKYIRSQPEFRTLPVVVLTGHASHGLIEEACRLGANSYFIKPFEFSKLVELVHDLYKKWGDGDNWSSSPNP